MAKTLLFNLYCDVTKLEADWNSLAITEVKEEWLAEIANYERILLGWNILTRLPSNICCLNNLLRLDLQHNNLINVPTCLFQLPLLRNLNISHNYIEELPELTQWRPSLNVFNVASNFLTGFPCNVDGCAVEYLNLSNNKLGKVPLGVCNMRSLLSLDISENKDIREFPIELGKLTKLINFSFKGMQVRYTTFFISTHICTPGLGYQNCPFYPKILLISILKQHYLRHPKYMLICLFTESYNAIQVLSEKASECFIQCFSI